MAFFTKNKKRSMFTAVIVMGLAFATTACGTSQSTASNASGNSMGSMNMNGSSAGNDSNLENVRVGYLDVMDDAQTMLASEAGLYKKHGLNVSMQQFTSGTDLIKAIVGGRLDAGVLGFTNALTWLDKGADIKIVGGAQMGYHSLIVRNDSGIHSISDLKGKSIASQQQGSTADIVLKGVVLKKGNLSNQDVQMQYVSPSVAIQSLAAKKVDAAFVFEPYDSIARDTMPVKQIYEIGKDWPFPCMVVITSGKMTKDHQAAVYHMLDAQKEAMEMLQKDPAGSAKYITKDFIKDATLKTSTGGTVDSTKVIEDSIQSQTFNWTITPDQIQKMQDIENMMIEQKILKKPFDVKKALDLSWQEQLKN